MSRAPDSDGRRVTPPARPSHVRWWICFIIFLGNDDHLLGPAVSLFAQVDPGLTEIHWNDTQFGTVNSCFLGAYAAGLLFFGRIIDRVGVKAGYAATVLLWSLAALSHTLVTTVGGFMVARIFLGLSEAGQFPGGGENDRSLVPAGRTRVCHDAFQ